MKECGVLLLTACILVLSTAMEKKECTPNGGVAYEHQALCEKYYICDHGVQNEFTCNKPLLFDNTYAGCNYPELTDCGNRTRPEGSPGPAIKPPGDDDFDCPEPGGAFPHPEICELYYVCADDVAYRKTCPAGQLFDFVYSGCNYAEQVDCGARFTPTPGPEPTRPPGEFDCPKPGGAFPHSVFCEKYYLCETNKPYLRTCPAKQVFDLVYSGCNWDDLVDCGTRTRPSGSTGPTEAPGTGPTKPPREFECPTHGGAFPHPEFCEKYYVCASNKPQLRICPAKQVFDLVYAGCNWEELVDCEARTRPDPLTARTEAPGTGTGPTQPPGTDPTNPPGMFKCPSANGIFANPKDCTSFYNCGNNVPSHENCPAGLYFGEEYSTCDYPANVDCGDRLIPSRR